MYDAGSVGSEDELCGGGNVSSVGFLQSILTPFCRNDGRSLVGQMLAYDKHMNFVLAECEEFRTVKVSALPLTYWDQG
jgi:hypothetical protein